MDSWHLENRVRELRNRLRMRQADLAEEAGVTRQTIIAIEKGRLNPSVALALLLARILREPADYVFYLERGPGDSRHGSSLPIAKSDFQETPAEFPVTGSERDEVTGETGQEDYPASVTAEGPAEGEEPWATPSEPDSIADAAESLAAPEVAPMDTQPVEASPEPPAPAESGTSPHDDDIEHGETPQGIWDFG